MDITSNRMGTRPAEPQDGPALFTLAHAFATSFAVERADFDLAFAELLARPEAFLAVGEADGEVAGYVLGFEHLTFFANGRVAWVEEIMVGASFRRQGVGGAADGGVRGVGDGAGGKDDRAGDAAGIRLL